MVNKHYIRTIITQDGEVDDQNSLRHFLLYSNEVELQGIIQTSSRFHWQGVLGAVKPEKTVSGDFDNEFMTESGPFDLPYRWTGTDWMFRVIDDYEKDYPNLIRHADGYPTPDYLRSVTKTGNIGFIKVYSEKGGQIKIDTDFGIGELKGTAEFAGGVYVLDMEPGETAIISKKNGKEAAFAPLDGNHTEDHYFGVKRVRRF